MNNLPNLEKILKYENHNLIKRFKKDYPLSKLTAEEALTNLIKYLWLCQKHEFDKRNSPHDETLKFNCAVHTEMHEIDNMWHTFLLFTKDYQNFCTQYFSEYMHHVPNTDEEMLSSKQFEIELVKYLSYVYDNLGEETLCQWFAQHLIEEHD